MLYCLPERDNGTDPKYTGDRIKRDRPQVYAFIVRLLGEGASMGRIRDVTGSHMRTISAIAQAERGAIEEAKRITARRYGALADLCIEAALDRVANFPETASLKDLAWTATAATEKEQLLLGQATDRRESTAPAPASEDMAAAYLASLPAAQVEDLPAIGLQRRIPVHREAEPTPPEVEPSATVEPVTRSQPDSESGDCTSIHKDSTP